MPSALSSQWWWTPYFIKEKHAAQPWEPNANDGYCRHAWHPALKSPNKAARINRALLATKRPSWYVCYVRWRALVMNRLGGGFVPHCIKPTNTFTLMYGYVVDFVHLEMWVVFAGFWTSSIKSVAETAMYKLQWASICICLQPMSFMLGVMRQRALFTDDVMNQIIATSVELIIALIIALAWSPISCTD